MVSSNTIEALAKSLAEAQKEIKPAKKDATNPFFKSGYSTLESVHDACLPALNKHEIAVTQTTRVEGGTILLETTLIHSSGQWISSTYPVVPMKNDPQSMGSAMSYARRYSLAAIAGVVSSDDDGESARARQHPSNTTPKPKESKSEPVNHASGNIKPSEAQVKRLFAIAHKHKWNNDDVKEYLMDKLGIESTSELTWLQYNSMVSYIEAFPKEEVPQ